MRETNPSYTKQCPFTNLMALWWQEQELQPAHWLWDLRLSADSLYFEVGQTLNCTTACVGLLASDWVWAGVVSGFQGSEGLACIWPAWRGDLLFLLLYSTCSRKLSKLGNYFWIHGLYQVSKENKHYEIIANKN